MTDNLRAWYKSSDQGWKYTGVHVRSCPRCAISSTKHEFVLVRVQLFKKSVFVSVHPWFKYPIKVFWNFSGERSKYISSLSRFFLCENSWSSGLFSDWPSLNPFWLAHSYLILRFFGWLNWKCYKLKNMCKNSAANNIASSKFSFSKLISKEAFQIYKINNQIRKLKSSQLKINWYLYNCRKFPARNLLIIFTKYPCSIWAVLFGYDNYFRPNNMFNTLNVQLSCAHLSCAFN